MTMRVQNLTPQSYATSQVAGQKRKRHRQPLSCQECRIRKIACDRGNPCSNCSKSSKPRPCEYGSHEIERPNGGSLRAHSPEVTDDTLSLSMDQRMARIENIVATLAEKVESGFRDQARLPYPAVTDGAHDLANGLADRLAKSDGQPAPYSEGAFATTEPGTMFYVGRTGWTMVFNDKSLIYAAGPRNPFAQQWTAYKELAKRFKGLRVKTIMHCTSLASCTDPLSNIESALVELIPDREICEVLFERYLLTFHSTHPVIDPQMFKSEMEEFWQKDKRASKYWLGLFVSVLAIGYELPVTPLYLPPGKALKSGRVRGREMLNKAIGLVFASPSTRKSQLACFQMLLLLVQAHSLDMNWVDGNSYISGLLGLATRMAFAMGFHRDPTMAKGVSNDVAQLRRVIWSTFKRMDFEFCMQSGMPFLLRDFDSDMHAPEAANNQPHNYQTFFSAALPVWARVVQMAHSNKAALPRSELLELVESMQELDRSLSRMNQTRQNSALKHEQVKTLFQRAILVCTQKRLMIILFSPTLHDPDPLWRMKAKNIIFESSRLILEQQNLLNEATDPGPTGDAMAHFHFATLHCNIYNAVSNMLLLLKPSFVGDVHEHFPTIDPQELFAECFQSINIMQRTLAFSPYPIKAHASMSALALGARERLRLFYGFGKDIADLEAPEARDVLEAMKTSMHESLAMSSAAIDKALSSDDPPSTLCAAPQDDQQDQDQGPPAVPDDLFAATNGADAFGNPGFSDTWNFGNEIFSDVDLGMPTPFWLPFGF